MREQRASTGEYRGSKGRSKGILREHRGSTGGAGGEHERAQREHMTEMGLSARAMRRYRIFKTRGYYIYYIHPELRIDYCRFRSGKGAEPL